MASYRQIHTKIWTDPWFIELGADEKLLFIYLFSNDRANLVGIYDISVKTIAHETGISRESVEKILTSFETSGKVFRDGNWLWIVNLLTYNAHNTTSEKIQKHIEGCLAGIGSTLLRDKWLQKYAILAQEYGIDRVYIPLPTEQEQEPEQEPEQEKKETPESPKAGDSDPPPKRTDQEMFDAVMMACNVVTITAKFRGSVNRWIKKALADGVLPSDVRAFGRYWTSDKWRRENRPLNYKIFPTEFDIWVGQGKPKRLEGAQQVLEGREYLEGPYTEFIKH